MISSDFFYEKPERNSLSSLCLLQASLCQDTALCAVFLALCYELSDRNITIRSMKMGDACIS